MRPRYPGLIISVILLATFFTFSQVQPSDNDADKEKNQKERDKRVMQMLDSAVVDANTLVLPENRALVLAITGDLYWKFDDKRSRELFRNAAAELVLFNQTYEKEKRENLDNPLADLMDIGNDQRSQILPLVAKHDAELALDLLLQTRPAKLADAMNRAALPNAKQSSMMDLNPESLRVRQEISLEQQFAFMAADENPDKAIKLIKDSLSKGLSSNVLPLLQKLSKKDDKKAVELAGDVIKKVVDSDLVKNEQDLQVAVSFLQYAYKPPASPNSKEKRFAFSDAQVTDLAVKVASTLLQPSRSMMFAMILNMAMPMLEKFVPDKAVLLRQRHAEMQSSMPSELSSIMESQKLWDANSTPEDIIAQIPKLKTEIEKTSAYSALAKKIGELDDEARAKKLIDQITDEKARANAQEQFDVAKIGRSATAGKLDEARKTIGTLTKKKTQIQRLVSLAIDFQNKGGEKDIATAKSLMKDAKALTNELAQTEDDLADVMEVVKGFVTVDPDTAFRMFEPVIERINDYVQASSVLATFQPQSSSFRNGEVVLKINGNGRDILGNSRDMLLFRYISQMQLLGKADLDRMNLLVDHFVRNDCRTIVKLFALQGYLKDEKQPGNPSSATGLAIYQ
jgi:hypothetical protein